MHPRRWLSVGVLGLSVIAAAAGRPAADADARKTRILKLFAEEFVALKPGSFRLGSTAADAPATEKPTVEVTFRAGFALARYEVTQELYEAIAGKNPARWKGPRNSVEMVSWDEANTFCHKATTELRAIKLLKDGEVVRLPSEAEWEYACRAGTTTKYSFGDNPADLRDFAWYDANSKGEDPPVGRKKPNAWGLYDMHGYIWEWCADAWAPSHAGAAPDGSPRQAKRGDEKLRTIRGGAYNSSADQCRSAFRAPQPPDFRGDTVGLRCAKASQER